MHADMMRFDLVIDPLDYTCNRGVIHLFMNVMLYVFLVAVFAISIIGASR